ncbi:hypothetical protein glysoja_049053 [Glycine soja]|uniref:Uncharacterized protein n=1 Tax=Glycine soja TaxID=3848 RepID=A0A0B2SBE6_GLYSO|nr:hypothetical protein glysoja_049053 [Glycine soja]
MPTSPLMSLTACFGRSDPASLWRTSTVSWKTSTPTAMASSASWSSPPSAAPMPSPTTDPASYATLSIFTTATKRPHLRCGAHSINLVD